MQHPLNLTDSENLEGAVLGQFLLKPIFEADEACNLRLDVRGGTKKSELNYHSCVIILRNSLIQVTTVQQHHDARRRLLVIVSTSSSSHSNLVRALGRRFFDSEQRLMYILLSKRQQE